MAHLSFPKPENQDALHCAMHLSFDYTVKRFLLAYHAGVSVGGLAGKERRNDLEELSWQAVRARGWVATALGSVSLAWFCDWNRSPDWPRFG
jgi:hypothetical protein